MSIQTGWENPHKMVEDLGSFAIAIVGAICTFSMIGSMGVFTFKIYRPSDAVIDGLLWTTAVSGAILFLTIIPSWLKWIPFPANWRWVGIAVGGLSATSFATHYLLRGNGIGNYPILLWLTLAGVIFAYGCVRKYSNITDPVPTTAQ